MNEEENKIKNLETKITSAILGEVDSLRLLDADFKLQGPGLLKYGMSPHGVLTAKLNNQLLFAAVVVDKKIKIHPFYKFFDKGWVLNVMTQLKKIDFIEIADSLDSHVTSIFERLELASINNRDFYSSLDFHGGQQLSVFALFCPQSEVELARRVSYILTTNPVWGLDVLLVNVRNGSVTLVLMDYDENKISKREIRMEAEHTLGYILDECLGPWSVFVHFPQDFVPLTSKKFNGDLKNFYLNENVIEEFMPDIVNMVCKVCNNRFENQNRH